ncbi:CHRD domain-containing protein [Lacinutrix mariniflava]|uniref:CHRD domain-containing protein n=1 Tax=Lacinutrix mariniflava TaxID=342955 RepID=UPI0006E38DE3|nr:CHRD domain-containing protein [Lacinutrix mariniflava]
MKTLFKVLILLPLVFLSSCRSDDAETDQVTDLESKTYVLTSVEDSGISGTVRFIKNSNFTLSIELNVSGTINNNFHSAFLYRDNAANGGEVVALTLDTVVGETGMSTTVFTKLDDDTTISYEDLLTFDGYIEVKSNDNTLNNPVANADIGENELTGSQVTYTLEERDLTNAFGDITFKERINGEALAVFNLEGTPAGGMLPAHIHENDAVTGGPIIFTFKMVNGTTGSSETNVEMLDDGTSFVYNDVLTVNGYINVHFESDLSLLIAQGNIGSN